MRILISILFYLVFSTSFVIAQDRFDKADVPQTTRECRTNLSSLGRLIRKHNPNEEHMIRLRKQARSVSDYCQDEKFSRAHRLFLRLKRSIKSVNNADTDITPSAQKKSKIKNCLDKLKNVGKKVTAASLEDRDRRQIGKFGKRMYKNCRLQRFRRADKDHAAILRNLKRFKEIREARTGAIRSTRGCRIKIKKFNTRINYRKLSRQVKTWIRKSVKEIITLCRKKKFNQAEQKYQAALGDFSKYLKKEEMPVVATAASAKDMKNCRRSYTYSFKMINKKKMSSRQRRTLLAKRKTLGQYCYEKDFSNAKRTFKELRRALSRMDTKRSASHGNSASYTVKNTSSNEITRKNCDRKIQVLESQASDMNLSPRNARGLQSGRKRIKSLCNRNNFRGAGIWHKRVQKRMLQLSKDHNRYSSRIARSKDSNRYDRNTRPKRGNDRQEHNTNSNQNDDTKESCLQKYKMLVRRIADNAHSFRLKTILRLKAASMRRACKRQRFNDATDIYQKATQALDRQ